LKNRSKVIGIFCIGAIFLCTIFFSSSYAIFSNKIEGGSFDIQVGELEYSLEIGEVNQITVAPRSTFNLSLKLISKNPIDTKYQLYYQLLTNIDEGSFEGGYLVDTVDYTTGVIQGEETKEISILFNNFSNEAVHVEFGTISGLVSNPLELKDGQLSLSQEIVPKYFTYSYTGEPQTFTVPVSGNYKIELWGASGNNGYNSYTLRFPAYGAYTSGVISLTKGSKFYVYVGGSGKLFNCCHMMSDLAFAVGSGGATDVRLVLDSWNKTSSLASRIMVAGAAGGTFSDGSGEYGGDAGGLRSYATDTYWYPNSSATQTKGGEAATTPNSIKVGSKSGSFGIGASISWSRSYHPGAGGYYGGNSNPSGGGGSSYISGHNGCVAITSEEDITPKTGCSDGTTDIQCSYHYSGYRFTDTMMIDGKGYQWTTEKQEFVGQPTHDGFSFQVGNNGDGFAKITRVE